MDEPTSNLDPRVAKEIRELVLELSKYKIVLYSSHNLYEAREIGSEVIAISQGKGIALLPASKIWVGLGAFAAYVALVYVFIPVGGAGSPAAFVSSPPLMDILLVAAVVAVVGYLAWRIPAEAMGPRSARPAAGLGAAGMLGLAFSGDSSFSAGQYRTLYPGRRSFLSECSC